MDARDVKEGQFLEEVVNSREQLYTELEDDRATAHALSTRLQNAAQLICAEAARAADEQMSGLGIPLDALNHHVDRAKSESETLHKEHAQWSSHLAKP